MYRDKSRGVAWVLLCAMLLPAVVLAESETAQLEALEARVTALEEQVAQLLSGNAEPETEEALQPLEMGQPLLLAPGHTLTVTAFDTGSRFRYSPSGGLTMLTLSAKSGYRLLCLYVTVQNDNNQDFYTSKLVDAELLYGNNYRNKAQDSFFYKNTRGVFVGGLKAIGPKTTVEGCLLFAVPDEMEASREPISVRLLYDDVTYECVLRLAGSLLEEGEASEVF